MTTVYVANEDFKNKYRYILTQTLDIFSFALGLSDNESQRFFILIINVFLS